MENEDAPIRGEVRRIGFRRVSHGLYLPLRVDLSADEEYLRDLRAYQLVLPRNAVFTHLTAARLYGWRLPREPEVVPVFAAARGDVSRPRRHGVICSRLTHKSRTRKCQGMPVDAPEEVLLRAARDLGTLDLVILLDSALEKGDLDPVRLRAVLESRRPGVRRLRAAYAEANPVCESAGESVLRLLHQVMDVPVQPQVDLHDETGRHLGRADLLVTGTDVVHEYDGADHRTQKQHTADLRRERGWTGTTYRRRGFTLDDLINHPLVVMHELDRVLERPHHPVGFGAGVRWWPSPCISSEAVSGS